MGRPEIYLVVVLALGSATAADPASGQSAPQPVFDAAQRAVGNWRAEAAQHLAVSEETATALAAGETPTGVSRCVRLNNYWCIKGAGWNGMIAADAEGHAAFASAVEGAAVAALLLRRYYLEFGRKSAKAIVSRWAPPQCGGPVTASGVLGGRLGLLHRRPNLGPDPHLALLGLGNTLRARFLSARRTGQVGRIARSRIPDVAVSLIRAPTIAAGFGEAHFALPALRLASLVRPAVAVGAAFAPFSCALDGQRLNNYAQKTVEGVGTSPDDDLKLFSGDGEPSDALARVMENMSGVEIGPFRASPDVIRAGIETAAAAMRAARANPVDLKPAITEEAPELRPFALPESRQDAGVELRPTTAPDAER